MKGKRYTEEQIVHILQDVERGKSVAAVAREYGISETTVNRWRGRYRGMDRAELRRAPQVRAGLRGQRSSHCRWYKNWGHPRRAGNDPIARTS